MAIEGSASETRERRIRLGMVGGGSGAFIGAVHRMAARLDDHYELVAGALSSSPEKAEQSARELGLDPARSYGSFKEMAIREAKLKNGIEAVAIVTPNHVHYEAAKEFLKRGIHVICDKPLTSTLPDARKLKKLAEESDALFVLTHNYTGYPMVRQAREMVANGELGTIRLVQMEYPQDWLTEDIESSGQKQAAWRTDPAKSGAGGSTGDIGTHAYNLGCFVSGLELEELSADLDSFVPGRKLDDNAHVMMRFKERDGARAKGLLWCSQVAPGHENGLKVRVYGTKGGLEWVQADPNYLWYTPFGEPKRLITRNGAGSGAAAGRMSRIPSGHPEGYLEGFANIYSEAARAIYAKRNGAKADPAIVYPTIDDGLKGMLFVDACVQSSKRNGAWIKV
ncbi:Gfo/Idh/MocA family oxidoreductase [Shinella sp. CPCC 101442]|uniref:Gfo/Idh/MocA family protein n=1 Tax=Shinella sp. CPCC 101442 TaxID=2932265 RepID=UPI0021537A75|nr:Gfo/Idh/MocA family oxidoreductase [Shinella sp. CPCC 101442]MCR6502299.1 Gfo/Idh/MocA family oxidoreductase [Shinella sp. CPCC 101442]